MNDHSGGSQLFAFNEVEWVVDRSSAVIVDNNHTVIVGI